MLQEPPSQFSLLLVSLLIPELPGKDLDINQCNKLLSRSAIQLDIVK